MIGDDSRAHNVGMLIKAATEFQENYQNVPSFVGLLKGVS